ncbi:hypothetical protein RvY_00121 [Ramazzottius varieornatus]|uniref:Uncharacterized protein n=1 Tax=Ramazzottius varieornatus TaxID=947166 RepID=A0A1D1UJ28_RAMVA|nr:hypothetical protein RvY_00121 [Ramazzottius varieornatus]
MFRRRASSLLSPWIRTMKESQISSPEVVSCLSRQLSSFPFSRSSMRFYSFSSSLWKGHSHWQNIQATKGKNDFERSLVMASISRQLRFAVRKNGSADPKKNSDLAKIMEEAKKLNLPNDSIERVIAKMVGKKIELLTMEAKGPGGALMILEVMTDNPKRTQGELRGILNRNMGAMVDGGGIMFNFDHKTVVTAVHDKGEDVEVDVDKAEEAAIEAGAEEILGGAAPGIVRFVCDPMEASKVAKALEKLGYSVTSSESEYFPKMPVELPPEAAIQMAKLKGKIEDHADFHNLFLNCVV